jgi:hypothetical protein
MIDRPLAPCPSCHRHVAAEPACPFCGVTLASAPTARATLPGRFSRAAVFAGATLAGCWTSSPPTETTTTTTVATPDANHGRIEGQLRDPEGDLPGAQRVTLTPINSGPDMKEHVATTNEQGNFVFDNIPVGDYRLSASTSNGVAAQMITVRAGTQHRIVDAPAMHVRQHRLPNMPYGAPPARYRIV